jgi:nanoRNase/pAp phosphatase (c-di-AMP/oligoRNAs hydrolase)
MKEAILDLLGREENFLILLHSNADPDAVGSAIALKEFLRLHEKHAKICCHSANRMSKHLLGNLEEKIDCKDAETFKNIIILDTASSSQLGKCRKFLELAENVAVIDHHTDSSFKEYLYLREERTSTAEILFDMLPERNKKMNLALLSGILTDTGNFKYANVHTMETVQKIMQEGVELYEAFDMFTERKDIPKRIAILRGCQRSKLHKIAGYLIITTKVNSHESSTAAFLTQLASVAFVANEKAGRIIAKAAQNMDIDLSKIMKEIGQLYNGEGGGHKKAAGASGESISDALDHCVELLREVMHKKEQLDSVPD